MMKLFIAQTQLIYGPCPVCQQSTIKYEVLKVSNERSISLSFCCTRCFESVSSYKLISYFDKERGYSLEDETKKKKSKQHTTVQKQITERLIQEGRNPEDSTRMEVINDTGHPSPHSSTNTKIVNS